MTSGLRITAMLGVAALVAACAGGLAAESGGPSASSSAVPVQTFTVVPTAEPTPAPSPPASPSPEQAEAQRIVDRLLAPPGSSNEAHATAAAYVVTTFSRYRQTLPDAAGLPSAAKSDDQVLVIEVDGAFGFPLHCYATCPTVTAVFIGYDMTRHADLQTTYSSGKTTPNLDWVRSFGTPISLTIGSGAGAS